MEGEWNERRLLRHLLCNLLWFEDNGKDYACDESIHGEDGPYGLPVSCGVRGFGDNHW